MNGETYILYLSSKASKLHVNFLSTSSTSVRPSLIRDGQEKCKMARGGGKLTVHSIIADLWAHSLPFHIR